MLVRLLISCLTLFAFFSEAKNQQPEIPSAVRIDSTTLFDMSRQRQIPIMVYAPYASRKTTKLKLAVISHGYGGQNTAYSFIARSLVARGYVVVSIQHEIPGDTPLAMTGNPRETRRPNWERGMQNIRFTVQAMRYRYPTLNVQQLLLVGHSNGGDISMLFAETYPTQVTNVITLDNRRFPFPRTYRPRILSIRSSDQIADPGVLPTEAEQQKFGMTIVQLPVIHNDMWDGATDEQKLAITDLINSFLEQYN